MQMRVIRLAATPANSICRWVPDESGRYRGQMAVLVKPNGLLGSAYMAAIRPFRHLIVYPALTRETERAWRAPDASPGTGAHVPQIDP